MRKSLTLLAASTAFAAAAVGAAGAAGATSAAPSHSAAKPAAAPTVARAATAASAAKAGPGPFYWIVNVNSGKAVMPYNESKAVGELMVQRTKGNLGAQHWRILGSGTTRVLWNRNSHLCLLAPTNGTFLTQQYCNDTLGDSFGNRPKWQSSNYDAMWAGNPITWRSVFSGQCMDVYGAYTTDNTIVQQWPCHGLPNQQFQLQYVPGT